MKIERPRHPPVSAIVCGRCHELGVGGLFRPRAPNRKLEETPKGEDGDSIAGCISKEEKYPYLIPRSITGGLSYMCSIAGAKSFYLPAKYLVV